jgi:predicted phosphate transport protein (TIGR00153 family)
MADTRRLTAGGALAFVERVLRGGHNVFFELLEDAADNVVAAAELLDRLLLDFPDGGEKAAAINACEHRGDAITHELIQRLNREIATPIEHEDLLALISALDDIVDLVDEVAAILNLYHIEAPMTQAEALAHVLLDASRALCQAVHKIARFEDISAHVVEVHRLENEGDRLVRGAIASLFVEGIDPMVVIRWKDIFERLEDAIDSTERAAYVLESVVIKNT